MDEGAFDETAGRDGAMAEREGMADELGSGAEVGIVAGRIDAATSIAMKSSAPTSRATSTDERAREAGIVPTVAGPRSADPRPKVPA